MGIVLGINKLVQKKWTEEEDNILKKYYPKEGIKVEKRLEGVSRVSIKSRVLYLGLKYETNIIPWTEEEDSILKEFYPTEGTDVHKRLDRDRLSCKNRAQRLKVKYINNKEWKPEEIEIIKTYYPLEGSKVYKRLKGRSGSACKERAKKLKVKKLTKEELNKITITKGE